MGHLAGVAGAARAHGLSVIDLQLAALYDPRDALEVSLDTEAGPQLPWVTLPVLTEVTTRIRDGHYHWVNLSRGADVFAQAFRDADGSWAVEHREGSRHEAARTSDSLLVLELLWSWACDDGRWQARLAFAPVAL